MTTPIIPDFIAWNQPVSGNWSASQNWSHYPSGDPEPTSSDDVRISESGTYVVTLDIPAEVRSLDLGAYGADLGTQSLYIDHQTLKLRGGLNYIGDRILSYVSNNGIINISPLGSLEIGQDSGIYVYGTVINQAGGTLRNFGKFDNHGTLDNYGSLYTYNTLDNHGTLDNSGTLDNYGSLHTYNNLDNYGTLDNYGSLNNESRGYLYNYSTLDNSGTLGNYGDLLYNSGSLKNESGATIDNYYGYLYNTYGATLDNAGTLSNSNTIDNFGSLKNESRATIDNFGSLKNESRATIDNSGTLSNSRNLDNFGIVTNSGTLLNNGKITQYLAGFFIDNGGILAGSGSFNGDINLKSGSIAPGGKIVSGSYADTAGTFTVNGAINLNGGTIKLSVTGVKPGEYDSLIASSAAFNSGKVQISISNSDLDYINSEIAPGQKVSIPVLTVNGGLKLSSSFIASGIISPISDSQDIFKVSKSGNTLFLNITHI